VEAPRRKSVPADPSAETPDGGAEPLTEGEKEFLRWLASVVVEGLDQEENGK